MKKLCDFIRNLFLVPRCYVCRKAIGKEETGLCDYHRRQYAEERQIRCPICHFSYDKCRCLPQFASPYIRSYTRVARYREQSAVGKMLLRAKDGSEGQLYDFLAKEMVNVLQNAGISVDLVTYIPCSKESFERRGFDHGERLAKRIAKQLCISAEATLVCKKGEAQKTLQAQQRLETAKSGLRLKGE